MNFSGIDDIIKEVKQAIEDGHPSYPPGREARLQVVLDRAHALYEAMVTVISRSDLILTKKDEKRSLRRR